jgi:DNA polymerase-1
MEKLKGTYIDGIESRLDATDTLRGRFNQAVAATNRLSSADPNLQNIPARTPLGKRIRGIFVAREGYVLLRADYSQAELRVFADATKDPLFTGAYPWDAPAKDLHQEVADTFSQWGVTRKAAKNGVFGAIYGAEEAKLGVTFGVPKGQAGTFLKELRERAPALVSWRPHIHNLLLKQGYVETKLGWRNYYPLVYSPISSEVQAAVREAANMPIQGTVAGIVKMLMIEAHALSKEYAAHLILQVHDEVVYEVPERWAGEFGERLARLGHEIPKRWIKSVPMELTWSVGANWRDAA